MSSEATFWRMEAERHADHPYDGKSHPKWVEKLSIPCGRVKRVKED